VARLKERVENQDRLLRAEYQSRLEELNRLEKRLADTQGQLTSAQQQFAEQIHHEKKALEMQWEDMKQSEDSRSVQWGVKLGELTQNIGSLLNMLDRTDMTLKQEADQRELWNRQWGEFQRRMEELEQVMSAQFTEYNRSSANDTLFLRAVESYVAGRTAEALGYLSNCLTLNPQHVPAWRYRVLCYESAGLGDEALAAAQMVLRLAPEDRMMKSWMAKKGSPHQ